MHLKNSILLFCILLFYQYGQTQDRYTEFTADIQRLYTAKGQSEVNDFWNSLVSANRIPLIDDDSVAFLYRGEARSVAWMGDFNGWGSNKEFINKGRRIPGTNVWILKTSLPTDARLDYKIIVNDNNYILDPVNKWNQWSGVGGGSQNSELRMPEWKEDPVTTSRLPAAARGNIEKDLFFDSQALGYQLTYSVYTPPSYRDGEPLPVIYVADGYEYMHERLGNMITILDNLIYLKKIKPVIAVFIDHREPVNRSLNRRMQELAMNEKYLAFITRELIPQVEEKYSVSTDRSLRAIMGSSLGGLSAAYFAFMKPELFGLAGMQSPAFWFKPQIYELCEKSETMPFKMFMSTGVIHDSKEGAQKMRDILEKKGCTLQYREVNQGHSWGNFRDLTDDMLIYFFPADN
jgi:enterochelin esterase family protein